MFALSKDERQMLEFARRWHPYNGGHPEDIMVTFGLTKTVFYQRLDDMHRRHHRHVAGVARPCVGRDSLNESAPKASRLCTVA